LLKLSILLTLRLPSEFGGTEPSHATRPGAIWVHELIFVAYGAKKFGLEEALFLCLASFLLYTEIFTNTTDVDMLQQ
jgi:hypothetical protein